MRLRLFGDLETIGTVGDIMKMCPPAFKGCRGFLGDFVPPNLADLIQKRTQNGFILFRTYQGKTFIDKAIISLFYTWKLLLLKKKKSLALQS